MISNRQRLSAAISGETVKCPVFAVYDWFVRNRPIDWRSLFDLGLGQIQHADLLTYDHPHLHIIETFSDVDGQKRRDVHYVTDIGELHEWYLGEWRQEYLIKDVDDYRIMQRAWQDTRILPTDEFFAAAEKAVGENGITVGQLDRTPFQKIQIDYAGLARFSFDIMDQASQLMDLLECMDEIKLEEFRAIRKSSASQIKLWENLSIETMGPVLYRRYLVPMYHRIFDALEGSGKKLQVHYDGKLASIANHIQTLPFDGLDSVTPPPEGDLSIAQARRFWPDKFLWLHPTLNWYSLPVAEMLANIRQMIQDAGPARFCLMISEEVPPEWEQRVPLILEMLSSMD